MALGHPLVLSNAYTENKIVEKTVDKIKIRCIICMYIQIAK